MQPQPVPSIEFLGRTPRPIFGNPGGRPALCTAVLTPRGQRAGEACPRSQTAPRGAFLRTALTRLPLGVEIATIETDWRIGGMPRRYKVEPKRALMTCRRPSGSGARRRPHRRRSGLRRGCKLGPHRLLGNRVGPGSPRSGVRTARSGGCLPVRDRATRYGRPRRGHDLAASSQARKRRDRHGGSSRDRQPGRIRVFTRIGGVALGQILLREVAGKLTAAPTQTTNDLLALRVRPLDSSALEENR